jgi:hypothetical protein
MFATALADTLFFAATFLCMFATVLAATGSFAVTFLSMFLSMSSTALPESKLPRRRATGTRTLLRRRSRSGVLQLQVVLAVLVVRVRPPAPTDAMSTAFATATRVPTHVAATALLPGSETVVHFLIRYVVVSHLHMIVPE